MRLLCRLFVNFRLNVINQRVVPYREFAVELNSLKIIVEKFGCSNSRWSVLVIVAVAVLAIRAR